MTELEAALEQKEDRIATLTARQRDLEVSLTARTAALERCEAAQDADGNGAGTVEQERGSPAGPWRAVTRLFTTDDREE